MTIEWVLAKTTLGAFRHRVMKSLRSLWWRSGKCRPDLASSEEVSSHSDETLLVSSSKHSAITSILCIFSTARYYHYTSRLPHRPRTAIRTIGTAAPKLPRFSLLDRSDIHPIFITTFITQIHGRLSHACCCTMNAWAVCRRFLFASTLTWRDFLEPSRPSPFLQWSSSLKYPHDVACCFHSCTSHFRFSMWDSHLSTFSCLDRG